MELEGVGRMLRVWGWGWRILGGLVLLLRRLVEKVEMEIQAAEGEMKGALGKRDKVVHKGGRVARLEEVVREAEVRLVKL